MSPTTGRDETERSTPRPSCGTTAPSSTRSPTRRHITRPGGVDVQRHLSAGFRMRTCPPTRGRRLIRSTPRSSRASATSQQYVTTAAAHRVPHHVAGDRARDRASDRPDRELHVQVRGARHRAVARKRSGSRDGDHPRRSRPVVVRDLDEHRWQLLVHPQPELRRDHRTHADPAAHGARDRTLARARQRSWRRVPRTSPRSPVWPADRKSSWSTSKSIRTRYRGCRCRER